MLKNKILGSALLIAGTTIGAGMLALPITTGVGGTLGSVSLFVIAFLFMLLSVFLLAEAAFYCDTKDANIISIIQQRLGPVGSGIAWISSLLLLYSIVAAYIGGGGELFTDILGSMGFHLSIQLSTLIFVALFGLLVYFHAKGVDYVNRILMFGLIASFIFLIIIITTHVEFDFMKAGEPKYLLAAVPVVILAFTSHIIVPSLKNYLNDDAKALRKALLLGSTIPLGCYLLWQLLLIGALSQEQLWQIAAAESPITTIARIFSIPAVTSIIIVFSFFALVTSFLGAMLSLFDFLADGFRIKKTYSGKILLLLISLLPPIIFALYYPNGFIVALRYAGVFIAVLYGVLPALAVWRARYHENLTTEFTVPGGKFSLGLILVGSAVIIGFHMAATFDWLPSAG